MSSNFGKRFSIGTAQPEDNKELTEIIEADHFRGPISLLYTRQPNAYESLLKEGEKVEIVVCRDLQNNRIVGFGAYSINTCYINGIPEKVGYFFSLRSRPEYRHRYALLLTQVYEYLKVRLESQNVILVLTTILSDNQDAQKLLTKQHRNMPIYRYLEPYQVYIIKTDKYCRHRVPTTMHLKCAVEKDIPRLIHFQQHHGRRHQFFPVITPDDFLKQNSAFPAQNFYFLEDQLSGEILACGASWNQQNHKQYKIIGYERPLSYLQPFSALLPLLGYPQLPQVNSVLNFATLSFWVVAENNKQYCQWFLNSILQELSDYPFIILGVSQSSHIQTIVKKRRHLTYTSNIYQVSWPNWPSLNIDKLMPKYLECGRL